MWGFWSQKLQLVEGAAAGVLVDLVHEQVSNECSKAQGHSHEFCKISLYESRLQICDSEVLSSMYITLQRDKIYMCMILKFQKPWEHKNEALSITT